MQIEVFYGGEILNMGVYNEWDKWWVGLELEGDKWKVWKIYGMVG